MIRIVPVVKSVIVSMFLLIILGGAADAQTVTEFVFRSPTLISGLADQDGAVYKFTNVAPGIDATVTILGRSGPEVILDTIDIPLSNGMGYDKALQPQLGLHGTAPANTSWWMQFKVNFLKAGTTKAASIDNFVASAIDVDGDNVSIAENIQMNKANGLTTSVYSVLSSLLPSTAICPKDKLERSAVDCPDCGGLGFIVKSKGKVQNCGKCNNTGKLFDICNHPWIGSDIKVTGTAVNAAGIDTLALNNMATFSYANTNEVIFSYGATTGNASSSAGQRLNSLWFKSFNYNVYTLLPLQLLDFTAAARNTDVDLQWTTAAEKDFSHFTVERSYDGISFQDCATIMGNANPGGTAKYSYTEKATTKNAVIYYRLKMTDKNQHVSYSGTKKVSLYTEKATTVLSAYPNPTTNQLHVVMPETWYGKKAVASVFNSAGILMKSIALGSVNQVENLDLSQLARGMYTVNLSYLNASLQLKVLKN